MPRPKSSPDDRPVGPLLARNLYRLGLADIVVRSADLARLVSEKSGRTMSRQRVSALINAVHVEPETLAAIAHALGVEPAELTRPVEIRVVSKKSSRSSGSAD